jgi:3-oxochol-4-en-24-oyl-CoA dehydrogenase
VLNNRSLSIACGTSEIKRNQIAERILGLPRDPLIS